MKTINNYTGINESGSPQPVGEEKRVAAALKSLGSRVPANRFWAIGNPTVVNGAPSGYCDYDIAIPFIAATFGGDWGDRKAILTGHAYFHCTGSGAVEALDGPGVYTSEAFESTDIVMDEPPVLWAFGQDSIWHQYSGAIIAREAGNMMMQEMARRAVVLAYKDQFGGLYTPHEIVRELFVEMNYQSPEKKLEQYTAGWTPYAELKRLILKAA